MEDRVKVLIAEDDPFVRSTLHRGFSNDGKRFQAFCAPSGTTALLQFGLVRPDVIVLGIRNGDSACWDTLKRLRELSTVPIIAISSLDEPEIRIKSLRLGADYCVDQSVGMPELSARVRALVRRDNKNGRLDLHPQQAPA